MICSSALFLLLILSMWFTCVRKNIQIYHQVLEDDAQGLERELGLLDDQVLLVLDHVGLDHVLVDVLEQLVDEGVALKLESYAHLDSLVDPLVEVQEVALARQDAERD